MSLLLYVIGFVVLVSGLASIATFVGVSQSYILVAATAMLGLGLFTLALRAGAREPVQAPLTRREARSPRARPGWR